MYDLRNAVGQVLVLPLDILLDTTSHPAHIKEGDLLIPLLRFFAHQGHRVALTANRPSRDAVEHGVSVNDVVTLLKRYGIDIDEHDVFCTQSETFRTQHEIFNAHTRAQAQALGRTLADMPATETNHVLYILNRRYRCARPAQLSLLAHTAAEQQQCENYFEQTTPQEVTDRRKPFCISCDADNWMSQLSTELGFNQVIDSQKDIEDDIPRSCGYLYASALYRRRRQGYQTLKLYPGQQPEASSEAASEAGSEIRRQRHPVSNNHQLLLKLIGTNFYFQRIESPSTKTLLLEPNWELILDALQLKHGKGLGKAFHKPVVQELLVRAHMSHDQLFLDKAVPPAKALDKLIEYFLFGNRDREIHANPSKAALILAIKARHPEVSHQEQQQALMLLGQLYIDPQKAAQAILRTNLSRTVTADHLDEAVHTEWDDLAVETKERLGKFQSYEMAVECLTRAYEDAPIKTQQDYAFRRLIIAAYQPLWQANDKSKRKMYREQALLWLNKRGISTTRGNEAEPFNQALGYLLSTSENESELEQGLEFLIASATSIQLQEDEKHPSIAQCAAFYDKKDPVLAAAWRELAISPADPSKLYRLGMLYIDKHDYINAKKCFLACEAGLPFESLLHPEGALEATQIDQTIRFRLWAMQRLVGLYAYESEANPTLARQYREEHTKLEPMPQQALERLIMLALQNTDKDSADFALETLAIAAPSNGTNAHEPRLMQMAWNQLWADKYTGATGQPQGPYTPSEGLVKQWRLLAEAYFYGKTTPDETHSVPNSYAKAALVLRAMIQMNVDADRSRAMLAMIYLKGSRGVVADTQKAIDVLSQAYVKKRPNPEALQRRITAALPNQPGFNSRNAKALIGLIYNHERTDIHRPTLQALRLLADAFDDQGQLVGDIAVIKGQMSAEGHEEATVDQLIALVYSEAQVNKPHLGGLKILVKAFDKPQPGVLTSGLLSILSHPASSFDRANFTDLLAAIAEARENGCVENVDLVKSEQAKAKAKLTRYLQGKDLTFALYLAEQLAPSVSPECLEDIPKRSYLEYQQIAARLPQLLEAEHLVTTAGCEADLRLLDGACRLLAQLNEVAHSLNDKPLSREDVARIFAQMAELSRQQGEDFDQEAFDRLAEEAERAVIEEAQVEAELDDIANPLAELRREPEAIYILNYFKAQRRLLVAKAEANFEAELARLAKQGPLNETQIASLQEQFNHSLIDALKAQERAQFRVLQRSDLSKYQERHDYLDDNSLYRLMDNQGELLRQAHQAEYDEIWSDYKRHIKRIAYDTALLERTLTSASHNPNAPKFAPDLDVALQAGTTLRINDWFQVDEAPHLYLTLAEAAGDNWPLQNVTRENFVATLLTALGDENHRAELANEVIRMIHAGLAPESLFEDLSLRNYQTYKAGLTDKVTQFNTKFKTDFTSALAIIIWLKQQLVEEDHPDLSEFMREQYQAALENFTLPHADLDFEDEDTMHAHFSSEAVLSTYINDGLEQNSIPGEESLLIWGVLENVEIHIWHPDYETQNSNHDDLEEADNDPIHLFYDPNNGQYQPFTLATAEDYVAVAASHDSESETTEAEAPLFGDDEYKPDEELAKLKDSTPSLYQHTHEYFEILETMRREMKRMYRRQARERLTMAQQCLAQLQAQQRLADPEGLRAAYELARQEHLEVIDALHTQLAEKNASLITHQETVDTPPHLELAGGDEESPLRSIDHDSVANAKRQIKALKIEIKQLQRDIRKQELDFAREHLATLQALNEQGDTQTEQMQALARHIEQMQWQYKKLDELVRNNREIQPNAWLFIRGKGLGSKVPGRGLDGIAIPLTPDMITKLKKRGIRIGMRAKLIRFIARKMQPWFPQITFALAFLMAAPILALEPVMYMLQLTTFFTLMPVLLQGFANPEAIYEGTFSVVGPKTADEFRELAESANALKLTAILNTAVAEGLEFVANVIRFVVDAPLKAAAIGYGSYLVSKWFLGLLAGPDTFIEHGKYDPESGVVKANYGRYLMQSNLSPEELNELLDHLEFDPSDPNAIARKAHELKTHERRSYLTFEGEPEPVDYEDPLLRTLASAVAELTGHVQAMKEISVDDDDDTPSPPPEGTEATHPLPKGTRRERSPLLGDPAKALATTVDRRERRDERLDEDGEDSEGVNSALADREQRDRLGEIIDRLTVLSEPPSRDEGARNADRARAERQARNNPREQLAAQQKTTVTSSATSPAGFFGVQLKPAGQRRVNQLPKQAAPMHELPTFILRNGVNTRAEKAGAARGDGVFGSFQRVEEAWEASGAKVPGPKRPNRF